MCRPLNVPACVCVCVSGYWLCHRQIKLWISEITHSAKADDRAHFGPSTWAHIWKIMLTEHGLSNQPGMEKFHARRMDTVCGHDGKKKGTLTVQTPALQIHHQIKPINSPASLQISRLTPWSWPGLNEPYSPAAHFKVDSSAKLARKMTRAFIPRNGTTWQPRVRQSEHRCRDVR